MKFMNNSIGLLLLLASNLSSAFSFTHTCTPLAFINARYTTKASTSTRTIIKANNNDNDPTNNLQSSLANKIQNLFTNFSPLNEGKKKIVQSLAGPYDKTKIQNELKSLIQNEPVLMLSFTK